MSRFWGKIGLNRGPVETRPGILEEVIEEVEVYGEIRGAKASWPNAGIREGIHLQHVLSMITPEDSEIDPTEAVYVVWKNRKWAVKYIQFKQPRVELGLGGLYNG